MMLVVANLRVGGFFAHLGPVALAGLCVNWLLIHWICLRGPIDRVSVAQAFPASTWLMVSL